MFIESTYDIRIDPGDNVRFESSEKIINMIKKGNDTYHRGNDLPLMSFIDKDQIIYIEYDIPAMNILELLVRELVQYWQITEAAKADNELAEGHIAFVTIQFLGFAGNSELYRSMLSYYESTKNISGTGYRRLIKALLSSKQYHDNPFMLFIGDEGQDIKKSQRSVVGEGDYGIPYVTESLDRCAPDKLHYYYYDHLPERLKPCYELLYQAVKDHEDEVKSGEFNGEDFNTVLCSMKNDHPELFWFNQIERYYWDRDLLTAVLDYGADKSEAEKLQQRVNEAVKPFLEGITPEMSAYDILIRLHVRMINHIDYDSISLEKQDKSGGSKSGEIDFLRQITGALLEGKSVCAGYAKTMQHLANLCGIECTYCRGNCRGNGGNSDGYHGWNVVKLDGDYYHLDVTWCDQSNTIQIVKDRNISFKYFCVTTEEICRSRNIDTEPVARLLFRSLRVQVAIIMCITAYT